MPPETARPTIWDSRPGLNDLRVAAESEAFLHQNSLQAQAQQRLRRQHLARQHPSPEQSTLAREHWRALRSRRVEDLAALTASRCRSGARLCRGSVLIAGVLFC